MKQVAIVSAFAACLVQSVQAVWDLESLGDGIFAENPNNFEETADGLEGLDEEGQGALYYDPKEGVLYEISTDAPPAEEESEEESATGATNEDTISS